MVVDNEPTYEFNGLLWTKTFGRMPWKEAMAFCQSLNYGGYSDWRLATVDDLFSIIDRSRYRPACSLPDTVSSYYWSSTTYAYNTVYAWYVYFGSGSVDNYYKSSSCYVRAVRGGKKKCKGGDAMKQY